MQKTKIVIEKSYCKGCGICVEFCPRKVLKLKKQKVFLDNEQMCVGCKLCELRCPDFAIYIEKAQN